MSDDLHQIEQDLLLEAIYRRYGYDFREYACGALKRRIVAILAREGVATVSGLQERVLRDPDALERFVGMMGVHAAPMFSDPHFYHALREKVIPRLKTYPFIRIWIAGCSSGEEVYATAIVLHECGIYDRCRIYATDMSAAVVRQTHDGIFPLTAVKDFTRNYQAGGGARAFSGYYTARYDHVIFRRSLIQNVTFAQHNPLCDASFNEFNIILCRNLMTCFSPPLKERVLQLFDASLCRFGILGIGRTESLEQCALKDIYEEMENSPGLYRRKK